MKNTIEYYYNIEVSRIHQKDKTYYIFNNQYNYMLILIENLEIINEVYNLSNYLKNYNMSHQIELTKDNQLYIEIQEEKYILLKILNYKNSITYNEIFKMNSIIFEKNDNVLRRDDWYKLWTNKIDYFEYQISQSGKKYPLVTNSFSYYVGLAENAIMLYNQIDKSNLNICLSHKRIKYNDSTNELYNPLNLVIDYRIRDICEYLKDAFVYKEIIFNEIYNYIIYNNLNYDESCLFFSRLLYPSYYFDIYEKIVSDELEEKEIKKILIKVSEYETLLKKVYYLFRQNNKLPEIEWLN